MDASAIAYDRIVVAPRWVRVCSLGCLPAHSHFALRSLDGWSLCPQARTSRLGDRRSASAGIQSSVAGHSNLRRKLAWQSPCVSTFRSAGYRKAASGSGVFLHPCFGRTWLRAWYSATGKPTATGGPQAHQRHGVRRSKQNHNLGSIDGGPTAADNYQRLLTRRAPECSGRPHSLSKATEPRAAFGSRAL